MRWDALQRTWPPAVPLLKEAKVTCRNGDAVTRHFSLSLSPLPLLPFSFSFAPDHVLIPFPKFKGFFLYLWLTKSYPIELRCYRGSVFKSGILSVLSIFSLLCHHNPFHTAFRLFHTWQAKIWTLFHQDRYCSHTMYILSSILQANQEFLKCY